MSGWLDSATLSRGRTPGSVGWTGRALGVAATLLVAYGSLSLFTLTARSPFEVAVEEACALGGWQEDQVHLDQGDYAYRFFFSEVRATLQVDTPDGRRPVEIRLHNDPLSGWSVRSLTGDPVDPGVRLTSTL